MDVITRGTGNVFVQTDMDSGFSFLTSVGVGDITFPRGERTPVYRADLLRSGRFVIDGFIQGEAGPATVTLEKPYDSVYNFLLEQECPFNMRINHACKGNRGLPSNYQIGILMLDAAFTSSGMGAPTALPDEQDQQVARISTSGEIMASAWTLVYQLDYAQRNPSGSGSVLDIFFVPANCGGICAEAVAPAKVGYAIRGQAAGYLGSGQFVYTKDGGLTWVTRTDPFPDRDPQCLVWIERVHGARIVVGGEPATGSPAAVAYTDDGGMTWVRVTVGSVNGQGINRLVMDQAGTLWAVADDGYAYASQNLGITWETILHGDVAQDLTDIAFSSLYNGIIVGASNTVLITEDGGATWKSVTGPASGADLLTVAYNRYGRAFVGTSGGAIYSYDGSEWTLRLSVGSASVRRIRFDTSTQYGGFAIVNSSTSVGTLYRSTDGGVTWDSVAGPTNTGYSALYPIDFNTVFVGGNGSTVVSYAPAGR